MNDIFTDHHVFCQHFVTVFQQNWSNLLVKEIGMSWEFGIQIFRKVFLCCSIHRWMVMPSKHSLLFSEKRKRSNTLYSLLKDIYYEYYLSCSNWRKCWRIFIYIRTLFRQFWYTVFDICFGNWLKFMKNFKLLKKNSVNIHIHRYTRL